MSVSWNLICITVLYVMSYELFLNKKSEFTQIGMAGIA